MSVNNSSRRGVTRTVLGSLLVAAAALAAQPSLAHGERHHGGGGGHHGMMMEGGGPQQRHMARMLDFVEATDAQRASVKGIADAAAAKAKPLRDQQRALREQARAQMNSGVVNRTAAESMRQQMVALHDQTSKIRLDAMLDIADQLTPEQRAKIGAMMAKRAEHKREHRMQHHGDAAPKS
ncbi:Spy/CpxP family protein refolding chaperone [Piscinibacter sakaiensis]|uniref:Spy/CpxP family protein refolding chaperone n=1 Tax=Piscinibacter sakaiensis TaxID=1547922 RepID=UPI003AAC1F53